MNKRQKKKFVKKLYYKKYGLKCKIVITPPHDNDEKYRALIITYNNKKHIIYRVYTYTCTNGVGSLSDCLNELADVMVRLKLNKFNNLELDNLSHVKYFDNFDCYQITPNPFVSNQRLKHFKHYPYTKLMEKSEK